MAFKFSRQIDGVTIRRKDFKSEREYIGAIYNANITKIAEALPGFTQEQFVNNVIATKKHVGGGVLKALDTMGKRVAFTPERERFGENVMKSIKRYGRYQEFRNLTRDQQTGRFLQYNPELMKYNRSDNSYVYAGVVQIFFDESPKDVVIRPLG